MDGSIIDGDELPLVEIFTISSENSENRLDSNAQSFREPDLTSVKKEIDPESEMNCDPDTNIVDNIATCSELVNKPESISVKKEIDPERDTNVCVKKEIDPDSDPDIICIDDSIATCQELVNKPEKISVKKEIDPESDTDIICIDDCISTCQKLVNKPEKISVKKEIDPENDTDIICIDEIIPTETNGVKTEIDPDHMNCDPGTHNVKKEIDPESEMSSDHDIITSTEKPSIEGLNQLLERYKSIDYSSLTNGHILWLLNVHQKFSNRCTLIAEILRSEVEKQPNSTLVNMTTCAKYVKKCETTINKMKNHLEAFWPSVLDYIQSKFTIPRQRKLRAIKFKESSMTDSSIKSIPDLRLDCDQCASNRVLNVKVSAEVDLVRKTIVQLRNQCDEIKSKYPPKRVCERYKKLENLISVKNAELNDLKKTNNCQMKQIFQLEMLKAKQKIRIKYLKKKFLKLSKEELEKNLGNNKLF